MNNCLKNKYVDDSLDECPYCSHTDFVTRAGSKPYCPEQQAVDPRRVCWSMGCLACKKSWIEVYRIEQVIFCN